MKKFIMKRIQYEETRLRKEIDNLENQMKNLQKSLEDEIRKNNYLTQRNNSMQFTIQKDREEMNEGFERLNKMFAAMESHKKLSLN